MTEPMTELEIRNALEALHDKLDRVHTDVMGAWVHVNNIRARIIGGGIRTTPENPHQKYIDNPHQKYIDSTK